LSCVLRRVSQRSGYRRSHSKRAERLTLSASQCSFGRDLAWSACYFQSQVFLRLFTSQAPLNMTSTMKNALASDFYTVKRTRRSVSLEIKHTIVKLAENGESNTEIARKLELPRTTVVTILKDKLRILEEVKCRAPLQTKYIRRQGKRNASKSCNYRFV
jgi:hypothetical protein